MTVLHSLPFKANSAADQPTSDEQNQRDNSPRLVGGAKSAGWTVTDPPSLPKARESEEILKDLRDLDVDNNAEVTKLAREQLFAPQVMLRLAGDYYVCFGGPGLEREPMKLKTKTKKRIDSRDIHPTLSRIKKPNNPTSPRRLPRVVFDIGRLSLKTDDAAREGSVYEQTDYRVVLDMKSRGIWLFYEYYKLNPDDLVEKIEFSMNKTLRRRVGKEFDSAKVLNSITDWNNDLSVTTVEKIMKESCGEVHAYITPALSINVKKQLRTKSSKSREKVPSTDRLRGAFSNELISIAKSLVHDLSELPSLLQSLFRGYISQRARPETGSVVEEVA
jgi:hypothetical protein